MRKATTRIEDMSPRARWGLALSCLALGTYPVLLAIGVVDPEPGQVRAPRWIIGPVGLVFVALGLFLAPRFGRQDQTASD